MMGRVLPLFLLLLTAAPAAAVSISGIMVYSADDFGTPSGFDTFDRPEAPEMHMWRTYAAGKWHSLAVYEGLPPQSLTGRPRPLNAGDFSVDIPLIDGENYFTIVGEPGPITATDTYQRFVVNLYFDGGLNAPGISALFERYAPEEGGVTSANRSQYLYSFDVILAQKRSPGIDDVGYDVYDDGFERVTVTGASFLPEDRFISVDAVAGQRIGQSGTSDFVGSLVVLVEPSEGGTGVGGIGGGTGGRGGVATGTGQPRGNLPGGSAVGAAPYVPGYATGGGAVGAARSGDYEVDAPRGGSARDDDDFEWVSGDETDADGDDEVEETPTPRDVIGALRNWIASAADETPTPSDGDEGDSTAENDAKVADADVAIIATATPTAEPSAAAATAVVSPGSQTPSSTPATTTPTKTPSPDATATTSAVAVPSTTHTPVPSAKPLAAVGSGE